MTVLSQILETRSIDFHAFCKKADLHTSKAYQIRAGKQRLGPAVRRRVAQAVGEPEENLFDKQGWPLELEAAAR